MQWSVPREELKLAVQEPDSTIKPTNITPSKWRQIRTNTLKHTNNRCRYCGGGYSKYLICFYLTKDRLDVCCRMCYTLTHLNYNMCCSLDELILCYSKLDQLDILRKTVNFTIKTNTVPNVLDIDPQARKLNLSVMELCALLIAKYDNKCSDYKIFFTNKLDTTFIDSYIDKDNKSSKSMFIDAVAPVNASNQVAPLDTGIYKDLKMHKFSKDELEFLERFFDVSSKKAISSLMKRKIKQIDKLIEHENKIMFL